MHNLTCVNSFIPSTSSYSLSSWFTSSCTLHLITVHVFAVTIYHSHCLSTPGLKPICSTNPFHYRLLVPSGLPSWNWSQTGLPAVIDFYVLVSSLYLYYIAMCARLTDQLAFQCMLISCHIYHLLSFCYFVPIFVNKIVVVYYAWNVSTSRVGMKALLHTSSYASHIIFCP